jgi:hypothetical protein
MTAHYYDINNAIKMLHYRHGVGDVTEIRRFADGKIEVDSRPFGLPVRTRKGHVVRSKTGLTIKLHGHQLTVKIVGEMSKRSVSFTAACRNYPHRFTMEHVPAWANRRPCDAGGTATWYYAPQYRTDREWYDNTIFPGEDGAIDDSDCYSRNPSWPLGQHLDKPYRKA